MWYELQCNHKLSIGHNKRKKIIDSKAGSERIAEAGTLFVGQQ